MLFVWDEVKRQSNLVKHGLDFADAHLVFERDILLFEDTRVTGEQRFIGYGILRQLVVVIVHVEDNEVIRLISMREATRNETNQYYRTIGL